MLVSAYILLFYLVFIYGFRIKNHKKLSIKSICIKSISGLNLSYRNDQPRPPILPLDITYDEEVNSIIVESKYNDELDELDDDILTFSNFTSIVTQQSIPAASNEVILGDIVDDTKIVSPLLTFFSVKPQDPFYLMIMKRIALSVTLLATIVLLVFTTSYYLFPGSFLPYSSTIQESKILTSGYWSSDRVQALLEAPEYSESGGVYFSDTDAPLPKTLVFVR
jgi:hypothetical protein